MKFSFLIFSAFVAFNVSSQEDVKTKPTYNRWSFDLNAGLNKTVRNFAPNYGSAFMSIGEVNFGARFMVNSYFGVDMKFGFDRFQDDKKSPDFATNMSRFGVQAVVDMGNLLHFYEWTNKFSVLLHTGVGLGNLSDDGFPIYSNKNDKIGTLTFGLTPQIKLNDRISLNMDVAVIGMGRQHHTWDYTTDFYSNNIKEDDYGLNGHFYTGTIGMSYYFGKNASHADWTPNKSVNKSDLDALQSDMEKMRQGMLDDDKDGVPNYIDQELSTPLNNPVDVKGVTNLALLDTDKDGISDANDPCPKESGPFVTNGCPDSDGDGVANKDDKCPNEKGYLADEGCAPKVRAGMMNESSLGIVYFETSSYDLSAMERAKLDQIAAQMKANSNMKVMAKGHADSRGDSDFNQDLSKNRALAAKNYLVKKGIDASRIEISYFGAEQPAESNDSENGRSMNRRVEIKGL